MLGETDKHYFHRYTDFYERSFSALDGINNILEFGVLEGASIRWLRQKFENAYIVGADILPERPKWPRDQKIEYKRIDQAHRSSIEKMFDEINRAFDIIIEDGSHIPEHQASCLLLGIARLRSGGIYVVEDIHTSLPHHPYMAKHPRGTPNCLSVLLALQHLRDIDRPLKQDIAESLSHPRFFSPADVKKLADAIATFELFQRTSLPLRCYACGSIEFRYADYRCRCGTEIYFGAESMSFIVTRK